MGHIVQTGAFDQSIRQKGLRGPGGIKLLAGHDPEKIAGLITRLETVGSDLQIDALLNLNISFARDLHEAAKMIGGLSFSVGFRLEEFETVDPKYSKRGERLIVKSGELLEVSIVSFPACQEATMSVVKRAPAITLDPARIEPAWFRLGELRKSSVPGNGQNHLRAALKQCRHRLMTVSEAVDCGPAALDAFSRGEVALSPIILKALARELFGGDYDVAADAIFLTTGPRITP